MRRLPTLTAITGLLMLPFLAAQVCAQNTNQPTQPTPFELSAEKHGIKDEDGQGLRIHRRQAVQDAYGAPPLPPASYQMPARAREDANGFNMRAEDWTLQPRVEAASTSLSGATVRTVRDLANFDLELIVDESLSMRRRDCPGGTSRWEWCGLQLSNLSNQLSPYAPRGFTLTTFASRFESYPNSTGAHVQQLFANPRLSSGTKLSRPLGARLSNYFASRNSKSRPLLLVVITDGVPVPATEPFLVTETLIAATRRMSRPNEITVVFFQIGGSDFFGRLFLNQMDNTLVRAGAKYDIVRTVSFERLQQQGLTASLIAAVRDFRQ